MDIGTREVRLGEIVHNPDGNWTTQIVRNMCDMIDGFMLGKKYLIHDRDPLFTRRFDMIFESIGVKIKKLPPFTPQMNSRMENFIRAIKTECLDKIIFTSEAQLRIAVRDYLKYWNHYRPHAGLDGNMVKPYPQDMNAPIREVTFLGGLLHGYRREPNTARGECFYIPTLRAREKRGKIRGSDSSVKDWIFVELLRGRLRTVC